MNLTAVSAANPLHPSIITRHPDPTPLAGLPACVEDAR